MDIAGVFASIDGVLGQSGVNIRENQSRQIGNGYAVTVYLLHNCPSEQTLSQLRELPVVKRVVM